MTLKPVRQLTIPESAYGVCLWEYEGACLSDGDGNFLSLEGVVGDKRVEEKMRKAALYWMEEEAGHPKWVPSARKISYSEWEDQNARLLDGEIPDEVDAARQLLRKGK